MCGRMNVSDSPFVQELMRSLGAPLYPQPRQNIAPGAMAEIVIEKEGKRQLQEALWSLLIETKPGAEGYRPNPRWRTFNAKSTRLNSSRLWSSAFRHQRAIIPASCFFEWKNKVCYAIEPLESAIAFAGLYRKWQFGQAEVYSFSLITLPGQSKFAHIHEKSYPLILKENEYESWLDSDNNDTEIFTEVLKAGLRGDIRVTPVSSPADMRSLGQGELIKAAA